MITDSTGRRFRISNFCPSHRRIFKHKTSGNLILFFFRELGLGTWEHNRHLAVTGELNGFSIFPNPWIIDSITTKLFKKIQEWNSDTCCSRVRQIHFVYSFPMKIRCQFLSHYLFLISERGTGLLTAQTDDQVVKVDKNGTCFMSIAVTASMPCGQSLNYASWPYDSQTCAFSLASWVHEGHEVAFKVVGQGAQVTS